MVVIIIAILGKYKCANMNILATTWKLMID